MDQKELRSELLQEYYKVSAIIQSYDTYFVSIKTWGVTVSGIAIGIGFSRGNSVGVFIIAFALSVAFWITEVTFKLLQLGHFGRIKKLEEELQKDLPDATTRSPRVYEAFDEKREEDRNSLLWLKVAFWPHVMFPHLVFGILSLVYIVVSTRQ